MTWLEACQSICELVIPRKMRHSSFRLNMDLILPLRGFLAKIGWRTQWGL
jgi:hypothetical protein